MQQPAGCFRLHRLVGGAQGVVVVLHRGGQVAGEDLAAIVVKGVEHRLTGVQLAAEPLVAQHRQPVGDIGHLQGVLAEVLLPGAPHQPPPGDGLHPAEDGEKRVVHLVSPCLSGDVFTIIL